MLIVVYFSFLSCSMNEIDTNNGSSVGMQGDVLLLPKLEQLVFMNKSLNCLGIGGKSTGQ